MILFFGVKNIEKRENFVAGFETSKTVKKIIFNVPLSDLLKQFFMLGTFMAAMGWAILRLRYKFIFYRIVDSVK